MSEPAALTRELPRLTSLRALAALLVFVYHLQRYDVASFEPLKAGYTGVAFFFVLSGFILTWNYPGGASAKAFYGRRLARVHPNHLVTLLAAGVLPVAAIDRGALSGIANVLLLHAWVPRYDVAFGYNAVSWSLSCEMAFYASFPLAVVLLGRAGPRRSLALAAVLFGATAGVVAAAASQGGQIAAYAHHSPLTRFSEFVLGMAAAQALRAGMRLSLPFAGTVAAASLVALAVLPSARPLPNVYLTPLFLVVIVVAAQRDVAGSRGPLTTRAMVYAGQLSFAFYLVHELVIKSLDAHAALGEVPFALVSFLLSGALAAVLFHGCERPAQRLLSRRPAVAPPAGQGGAGRTLAPRPQTVGQVTSGAPPGA